MDQNDLGSRVQNSSDLLRRGQFSDPLETGLTSDLKMLSQDVDDAARALGSAERPSEDAKLNRAMDDLAKLRDQIINLGGQGRPGQQAGQQPGQQPGQQGQGGQNGKRQTDALARNGQQGKGSKVKASRARANRARPARTGTRRTRWSAAGTERPGGQNGQAERRTRSGQIGDRLAGIIRQGGGGTNNSGDRGPMNDGVDPGSAPRAGVKAADPRPGPTPPIRKSKSNRA